MRCYICTKVVTEDEASVCEDCGGWVCLEHAFTEYRNFSYWDGSVDVCSVCSVCKGIVVTLWEWLAMRER